MDKLRNILIVKYGVISVSGINDIILLYDCSKKRRVIFL